MNAFQSNLVTAGLILLVILLAAVTLAGAIGALNMRKQRRQFEKEFAETNARIDGAQRRMDHRGPIISLLCAIFLMAHGMASAATATLPATVSNPDPAAVFTPRLAPVTQTTGSAATTNPLSSPFSFAEFSKGSDQATIVLYRLASYTPMPRGATFFGIPLPALPQLQLELDSFAGVQTSGTSQGVAGLAGLATWTFSSHWGVKGGLGNLMDLSKQFSLEELALSKLGGVFAVTYTP